MDISVALRARMWATSGMDRCDEGGVRREETGRTSKWMAGKPGTFHSTQPISMGLANQGAYSTLLSCASGQPHRSAACWPPVLAALDQPTIKVSSSSSGRRLGRYFVWLFMQVPLLCLKMGSGEKWTSVGYCGLDPSMHLRPLLETGRYHQPLYTQSHLLSFFGPLFLLPPYRYHLHQNVFRMRS